MQDERENRRSSNMLYANVKSQAIHRLGGHACTKRERREIVYWQKCKRD
jgi:hypothetical protein